MVELCVCERAWMRWLSAYMGMDVCVYVYSAYVCVCG